MRTLLGSVAFLAACTGGQRYTGIDGNAPGSDGGASVDAYEPDLEALSFTVATYPTGSFPLALAGGRLTRDTYPDLAVANGADNVSIFANQRNGTFASISSLPVHASAIAIGDFNNDGLGDLAVTIGALNPNLLVFLNGGDGTMFSGPSYYDTGNSSTCYDRREDE
jgi:hypothetical protein